MADAGEDRGPDAGVAVADVIKDPDLLFDTLLRFADDRTRRVGLDSVTVDGDEFEVSTVDLIWAHPGGHYETMVSGPGSQAVLHYSTRAGAEAGHAQVLADLRAGRSEPYC